MKRIQTKPRVLGVFLCVILGSCISAMAKDTPQDGKQAIMVNIYPTFGPYGPMRKAEYLPGDRLYLCYRIAGLTAGTDKRLDASAHFKLHSNKEGWLGHMGDLEFTGPFSFGTGMLCFEWTHFGEGKVNVTLPTNVSPDEYRLEMTVEDHLTGEKQVEDFVFNVLPKGTFGATNLQLCSDPAGKHPVGSHPSVGQMTFITFGLVGHSVVNGRIRVRCSLSISPEDGNSVLPDLEEFNVEEAVDAASIAAGGSTSFHYRLFLNRPGRFSLKLELEDLLAKEKREASYTMPLVVIAPWEHMGVEKTKPREDKKAECKE